LRLGTLAFAPISIIDIMGSPHTMIVPSIAQRNDRERCKWETNLTW
jgi:hypothetical protein